jgi:hypothetical protein
LIKSGMTNQQALDILNLKEQPWGEPHDLVLCMTCPLSETFVPSES